jgi:hypothetical protein
MNYILRTGTKLFMNLILFNKGVQLKIIWSSSIIFLLSNADLRSRTYSIALFWHYQDKVNNFILVLYFLPFNTPPRAYSFSRVHQNFAIQFALLLYGRHVHITRKDILQGPIHFNFKLSCITQSFYESYYNSYSIMASYLLKLCVCLF